MAHHFLSELCMRVWRNWQTHQTQDLAPQGVGGRLPSPAPFNLITERKQFSGRTPPCQGGGREFEPRLPLHYLIMAAQPSGKAQVCNTFITGSNPVAASNFYNNCLVVFYFAGVAELADARDSKSRILWMCRFDPDHRYYYVFYVNIRKIKDIH